MFKLIILICISCLWQGRYSIAVPTPSADPIEKNTESELQIGCEEGYSNETPETNVVNPTQEKARKARSYYYRIETPSSLISVWKPAYYRIQRPYYIPVYGGEGQIPIFFPPQPVFINAGFPVDNPPPRGGNLTPNQGYLPPRIDTSTEKDMFDNRFGEDYPVWDTSPSRTTPRPPAIIPTRRPKPARITTVPPLIHNEPTIPPPSNGGELGSRTDIEGSGSGSSPTTPRPSQCVWAIINCCAAGSQSVSNSCFERFACPGPFWDRSPCESDFARLAIQSALDYYANK
ncbi:uncharacterized protein [Onthophagus taurus]|uniref:uncharacterized protein n=1 Tax=Onthophagus taurus TaxID=166361 RepID=UPI0039BE90FF